MRFCVHFTYHSFHEEAIQKTYETYELMNEKQLQLALLKAALDKAFELSLGE